MKNPIYANTKLSAYYFKSSFKIISVALAVLLFQQLAYLQVPMEARDNKSTININDFEKINLSNGSFSFNLPLASLGGRGVGNGFSYNIESKWRRDEVIIGYSAGQPNISERINPDPYALKGLFPQIGGYLVGNTRTVNTIEIGQCSGETRVLASEKEFSLNFTGFGGQSFTFISQQNDGENVRFGGQGCTGNQSQSIGTVFNASDGSGTKFIAGGPITIIDDPFGDGYGNPNIYPSGVLKFANGTTYGIDGGLVSWIQDRNGNKTFLTNTGFQNDIRENRVTLIKDSLNREIQTSSDANFQYVIYKGFGGATRTIKISNNSAGTSTQMLNTLFPWMPSGHPANRLMDCNAQNYVELPDGRKYTLTYDCYGDLTKVELPTGGKIEYDYELVGGSYGGAMTRRITERRVYSNGVNLDNKTQYTYSSSVPPDTYSGLTVPSEKITTVKLIDNQENIKSVTKSYFYGCIQDGFNCIVPLPSWGTSESAQKFLEGSQFKSEVYDSNGTTLLRKTETEYQARTRSVWINGGNPPYKDYRVTSVTSTLADSGQVSKVTYGYDSTVAYNLQTDAYEYNYGAGQAGSFIERTHTEFEKGSTYTGNSVNLLNLPLETWVSSDINGNTKVSRTLYEYDNYASDANHAPLVNRLSITGHNSSYGTSYTTRGNVTKVTSFADAQNQTGAISVHTQYDIAGNVVKAIDGKGYASIINYNDNFGSPDAEARTNSAPSPLNGQQTFAFVTSATNAVGYTTYSQFDYYTGAAVDTEDIIGNVSSILFNNDVLDRPRQIISANNRPQFRTQTTIDYDDANRKITTTSDSKVFGDNLVKSEVFYDQLGRTKESRLYESGSNYIKSLQEYDSLGRAYRASTPHRPHLNEQPQWSESKFDSLGRVIEIKTPDNAVVTRSYSGSTTTVTDQSLRKRSGITDAIGRMTKVVEDPGGLNYETTYAYDVLGRLRKTTQTEGQATQNRYFMYDDLGRLIRAKQTEQIANSSLLITDPVTGNNQWSVKYVYDNNGNVTSTTDARNKTVTGIYDNLNRLTSRTYSDGTTPNVTFTYDDANVPNSKGQLTAVSSTVSSTLHTAFDQLGRIKSSQQTTNNQTYNFPDYSYDLSGALVSQTYHSGRIVKTETDNIGRLGKVTSLVPNQLERAYISNLSYTSFGAVELAKLGNGRWESAKFDPKRLQSKEIGLGASVGDTSLLKIEYDFGVTDNNGSLRQQKIIVPGLSNAIVQNYTYDTLNRLKQAEEKPFGYTQTQCNQNPAQCWKQTFDYDRFGNRTFDANNTTTLPQNNNIYNPNIDKQTNKFLVAEGYNYDNEGNLTSNPESQLFSYDAENRQTQVQNTATQTTANYQYDGNGKRVRKIVGQEETIFVYDAFGKLTAEYSTVIENRPKTISYVTSDDLGSPRVITNQIGQVVSRHDYLPFGEEVTANIGSRANVQGYQTSDGVRKQFTGYERDAESGLDYAQARYFSSKHGRFTSVDPLAASASIKNPQTFNRYTYGLNSPYKFTDPLGLSPCQVGASFGSDGGSCTQDRDTNDELTQKERDRALTRYIFERVSRGYLDDTFLMTGTKFDYTTTRPVTSAVTLNFSVGEMRLTVTRKTFYETKVYDFSGGVKSRKIFDTTETFQMGASSGDGDCMNNPDCAVDSREFINTGPIPIGSYVLNKNNITMLNAGWKSYVRSAGKTLRDYGIPAYYDYGSFRVDLIPVSPMIRDKFMLHGGSYPGSLGCIDVGGGMDGNDETRKLLELIRSSGSSKIALTVTR